MSRRESVDDGRSEEYLGKALRGVERDTFFVATKFGCPVAGEHSAAGGAEPAYVYRAVERSLRRLRLDHIDLYQLHEPDPRVPIEETLVRWSNSPRRGRFGRSVHPTSVSQGCAGLMTPRG